MAFVTVCMDCQMELSRVEDGKAERTSHGLCDACFKARMRELDEEEVSGVDEQTDDQEVDSEGDAFRAMGKDYWRIDEWERTCLPCGQGIV